MELGRIYVINWQGLFLIALTVHLFDHGFQVTALRTLVYLLMGPDQLLASEQQSLQSLDRAVSGARSNREIKRMMTEHLNISDRVANTYFIDFRKKIWYVCKRQKANWVEA